MFTAFIAFVHSLFSSPAAVMATVNAATKVAGSILTAFPGLTGQHTEVILKAVSDASSTTVDNQTKLESVASVVADVAPHLAAVAVPVAEAAYQLYKAEGSPAHTVVPTQSPASSAQ